MSNEITGVGEITEVIEKTQGERKYLFGTIGSDKIKNVTFVPVIERSTRTYLNEITEEGYQRPGSLSRMRAFANFLKDNPNSVVPPVLLSGRGNWKWQPGEQEQDLGRLIIQDKAAVIDGQHRLGGFVFLYEDSEVVRDISFILLPDLTVKEEIQEFVVVNNSQKGVPKPLTAYLEDEEKAQVGWALNQDSDSPFKGRITRVSLQRNHLFALHSVAKQVVRLFSIGSIQDLDVDQKIEFMSRFWTIIADQLPDEWSDIEKLDDRETRGRRDFEYKLLELTGLIAWAHTGAHIFSRSYSEATGMNWDNVSRLVEATSGIDWRKTGEYEGRTGEAAGRVMADEMIRMLPAEA
ncbi:MAG: DGQHR domain-containing protein [Gemmatimonadetes bacterium]|nr:DGQHR domain-containing protein [Gemmatimonadota bacterium]MYF75032.1 DGQHR domain-containing protein [Gemmatimonadota bacterium]MYK52686.1 DGQHR domain-containing protein [Gemmatimonadota bacterium]